MNTIAVSFTSESSDRYLVLIEDLLTFAELEETLKAKIWEGLSYLYIDELVTGDTCEFSRTELVTYINNLIEEN